VLIASGLDNVSVEMMLPSSCIIYMHFEFV
jgi:hypothetical protein